MYPNDQRAATLWYHDHTLGMTRLNEYAGPACFYLVRGGSSDLPVGTLPGPAPALGDPPGMSYYEIPIAIHDRSFNADDSNDRSEQVRTESRSGGFRPETASLGAIRRQLAVPWSV
jgi:FtsP/CotA-like multicopper oxidase with cupredoxin domain